ncbi:hypothetical protein WN943_003371 [Citrus x changshan-huyou]
MKMMNVTPALGKDEDFTQKLEDAETPLYPSCTRYTKLSAIVALYKHKAVNKWSDKSFDGLLELLHDMLPVDNVLLRSVYLVRKLLKTFDLGYEKIHACERSEGFKKIMKKQIPQTTGRRGLARMTEDMKKSSGKTEVPRVDVWIRAHTKKDGQPVNIQAGETISVKAIPNITKCKMLDLEWSDTVVAEGRWSSSDPNALVHHIPLGSNAVRVWVDIARQPLKFLWKVTPYMTIIEESVGTTIAWSPDRVILFAAK